MAQANEPYRNEGAVNQGRICGSATASVTPDRAAYLERAWLKEHAIVRAAVHGRYRDRGRCGEMSATIR